MVDKDRVKWLQEDYKRRYKHPEYARRGGIFTAVRRKQILGILRKTGKDRREDDFWYDVRETVKSALIDLKLFSDMVDDKNITQVLNFDSLEPVVEAFLDRLRKDPNRAIVASMLIERSFQYLSAINGSIIMPSQERQIEEAINLSKQLTVLVLPEDKRKSFVWSGGHNL